MEALYKWPPVVVTLIHLNQPVLACSSVQVRKWKSWESDKWQVLWLSVNFLLLLNPVSWALSIPAFQALRPSDQQLLLEESLLELMVVTALQFKGDASSALVQGQLTCFIGLSESAKLEELIKCMSSFSPPLNQLEFTSLKALLLFKPGSYIS